MPADVMKIIQVKHTPAGREFITLLEELVAQDVIRLAEEDPSNIGAIGRIQGELQRGQALLHILKAERVEEGEEQEIN